MKCLILASGFGTRLYPLTLNKAKSLLIITFTIKFFMCEGRGKKLTLEDKKGEKQSCSKRSKLNMKERIKSRLREIIRKHRVRQLPDEAQEQIKAILTAALARESA